MSKFKIQVKLKSESIFGSGYSIPGSVDLEIVCDEYGLPYMKSKTFKGNFRQAMEDIVDILSSLTEATKYSLMVEKLLGKGEAGVHHWETIKFSDLRLSKNIRYIIEKAVLEGKIKDQEVKKALTDIRSFTSVDEDGSSKKGSLRQIRVIKKDLFFEVDLHTERELTEQELGLLSIAARNLRHMGTMRTRGKGEVECTFLEKEKDVYIDKTDAYIDKFIKGVRINA